MFIRPCNSSNIIYCSSNLETVFGRGFEIRGLGAKERPRNFNPRFVFWVETPFVRLDLLSLNHPSPLRAFLLQLLELQGPVLWW